MPYINRHQREHLDDLLENLMIGIHTLTDEKGKHITPGPGVYNYVFSKLLSVPYGYQTSYGKVNEAIGILECAKLEFYRRIAAPYEDVKKDENGDVY